MLSVRYVLAYEVETPGGTVELTETDPVCVTERRGHVTFHCLPGPFTAEGVEALTAAAKKVLAGGQWFQLWQGDIISMDSPENDDGGCDGGVHRGPLVQEGAR